MQILLTSATENESALLVSKLGMTNIGGNLFRAKVNKNMVDYLCTGIGSAFTAYKLAKLISENKYDLVIQFGIAGSFNELFPPGAVVQVTSECFADLGVDDNGRFVDLFELNYLQKKAYPFSDGQIINNYIVELPDVPMAKGITVNTASGNSEKIQFLKKRYSPDVESMEGAALALVCASEKIKYLQLRAISNFVEPRNVKNWKTEAAIRNLTEKIIELLNKLN